MSRMIRGSLVALVLATPAALGAQNFEGRVTASIYGGRDRGPADVVILVKDGKSRLETTMGGMPMAMIMDYPGGTITTLMTPQKMYMKMSLAEAEAGMRSMTGATGNAEPPTVTRTGKKETIAGVSCEHVVFGTKDGGPQADVCTASGMGFFGGGGGMGGGRSGVPQAEQLRKEFKDGFFPLKIESIEGTNRVTRMEVKTVQRQSVDGALFTVPAGFTEMKMPMGRP